jgi:hypothetical protein
MDNKDTKKWPWRQVVTFCSIYLGLAYYVGNEHQMKERFKADLQKTSKEITAPVYDTTYLENDTVRIDSSQIDTFYMVPKRKFEQ